MAIKTHDGTNHNGLFDLLGYACHALGVLNTARGNTVPADVLAFLNQFSLVTPSVLNADDVVGVADAITAWQSGGASLSSPIAAACQAILVSFVQADTTSVAPGDLAANLEYLLTQMQANASTGGSYVSANTPGSSGTALPGGNAGDAVVLLDTVQGNGTAGQNALVETIKFTITSSQATLTPAIVATSPAAVGDRLDSAWPAGSGLSGLPIALTDPANSLLTNGQFETETLTNLPDAWIPTVATPGTTLSVTAPCVQLLTITGGDGTTGGTYVLTWSDGALTHATAPIPFASGNAAVVQAALQAISALAGVTVTSTGSAPNFTHTVTFTGLGGAVATLAATSFYTGTTPTITPSVSTAADSSSYSGQSLMITGNSSQLTTLYQALPILKPDTVYFLHFRGNVPSAPAAGVLKVSIVQGIAGAAAVDSQANSGSATLTLSGISPGWLEYSFSFRLSPAMLQPCYLKVALTTAVTSPKTVYLDDFALTQGQQLYNGGPTVAAFQGRTASAVTDTWTYTVTNTWSTGSGTPPTPGGGWQTWFNRVFAMADLGLLLPTTVADGTLLNDSLIT